MPNNDNIRIIKNTGMLYFRMLLTMIVTLYTSRVVLSALGANDFGIYSVVGGVVVMFSVLNSSMAAATSRFLIFELGKNDQNKLKKVFNAALVSHILIALIVLVLAETIGVWFLNNKLVIPPDRIAAARMVFQFSVLTTMISLTQVPYNSLIIAHQKMNVFAYVSILEASLKLFIAYLLKISIFDKLIFYSVMVFSVSLIVAMIYRLYCRRKFSESAFQMQFDKNIYKDLFSFSIWELYGGFALIGMGQGINMLLNIFFGPTVNAARGIAYQVQGAIGGFGNNFMIAVKPKIVMLYAENRIESMMSMVFSASKYSFYLTFFLTLPLLLEANLVMDFWLKNPPIYTVSFVRLVLINNLIISMRGPIVTAFHAAGNIKMANIISGSMYYFTIIIAYISLKIGFSPNSVFIITILVTMIVQINELVLLKRLIDYSIRKYFNSVIIPGISVVLLSSIIPLLLTFFMKANFLRFLIVGSVSILTVVTAIYFVGIDDITRNYISKKAFRFWSKRV